MNNNGVLSQPELVKVTTIEESYRGIKSAKDVEYFTALTWLNLDGNQLSSVDVSHNTALDHLYLSNNRLLWIGGVAESADPDLSGQQFGPVSAPSLDLAKAAPGIDVSRISNVPGGKLQGTVLTPASADGLVSYDYRFSDTHEPLHAQVRFESTMHTVTFDANGGTAVAAAKVEHGKTAAAPAAPTRDGYTFDGWYTAKAGGSKYDFSTPVTGDLTLYAHWTVKTAPTTITFRDVSSSTPHHEDIQWLADNGISTGWKMADGKYEFRGMSAVVRQDMAAFLRREAVKRGISDAATWKPSASDWNTFRDVNRGTPHAEDILWLAHAGISTGWKESDGTSTFRGMSPVVRQDMAAFLRRLAKLGKKDGDVTPKTDFTDVSNATPHADDVRWLGGSGISTGYRNANGTWRFEGMTSVYRQDMAAFLHRWTTSSPSKAARFRMAPA
ncbi:InlB B-repeat-containing protein [Bifidobacterium sp. AGR2158]|uniref:InlB B-repeat-containing protein n=1 Tax=Bifidobacterium sp. AGR2158 TaxID=1280675 RepID=UPI0009DC2FBB|nr:InlB B-repeat-containing protein [Bifidobacterium sp. AGR2158]